MGATGWNPEPYAEALPAGPSGSLPLMATKKSDLSAWR
jgi:hypothetical protein